MLKLIQFECKKIIKSTAFLMTMIVFILFIIAYYIIIYMNASKWIEEETLNAQNDLSTAKEYIENSEKLIAQGNLSEEQVHKEESLIEMREGRVRTYKARLKGYEDGDWLALLDNQIEDEKMFWEQSQGADIRSSSGHLDRSNYTVTVNLEHNKLLRERLLKPVFPIDISVTFYDEPFKSTEDEEWMRAASEKYDASALYFLHMAFYLVFNIFGIIFMLFVFGDILTKEGLGHNGPIHFLWTQPVKKQMIPLSKFLSALIVTVLMLVGMTSFILLLGTIFDRFGDGNYPIHVYEQLEQYVPYEYATILFNHDETVHFINLSTFLVQSLILFMFVLIFVYALLFFFSVLTKQTLGTLGSTILVILAGIMLSGQTFFSKLAPYFPFSYFSIAKVITKEVAVRIANFQLTFTTGMIVLPIYTILLLLLSFSLFKKTSKQA